MEDIDPVKATEDFLNVLNMIEKEWDDIYNTVGEADKETQDLLHEIELSNFNAFEGYQLAKELKEVRIKRRRAKDKKVLLNHLKTFMDNNKNMKITLFKVLTAMKQTKKSQADRSYMPRVRKDLKIAQI